MNDFILNAVSLPWLKCVMTFHLEMYKGQGSKAVHKKVQLGQRMLFFLSASAMLNMHTCQPPEI